MTKYEDMSLDELKKLKELKEKEKLIEEFASEDKKKEESERKEFEEKVRSEAIEDYLKQNPPASKLDLKIETKKDSDVLSKHQEYAQRFISKNGGRYVDYSEMESVGFEYTDSNDGCDIDVSDWSPADTFSKLVWHAQYCEAGLQSICVKGLNVAAGDGLSVQIRTVGKFGEPATRTACQCLSCSSIGLDTYTITIASRGLMTEICELDVFNVGEILRTSVIKALGKRWQEYFDAQIYAALEGAAAGYEEELDDALGCSSALSGSCCTNTDAFNLYHAVINIDAEMREASYRPDYLIVSPTVAAYFKFKDAVDIPYVMRSEVDVKNGVLTRFSNLKVIEYCGANSCTDESGEVVAIIIDSSRAVGMAFGKPPKTEFDRNIDCDSTTIAMWCYVGFSELDLNAIGHIVNP